MRYLVAFLLSAVSFSTYAVGQCDEKPKTFEGGDILKKFAFHQKTSREVGLSIRGLAQDSSWISSAAEAPVVTIFVDGQYNQDVVLFAGPQVFEYKILLGKLASGNREIVIAANSRLSALRSTAPSVISAKIIRVKPDNLMSRVEKLALANSPFISARPNAIAKFSDIPMISYYEILEEPENITRIRYTTIFSNEDGGTQSTALMARWGRMTDIEWVYEIALKNDQPFSETLQGANHETKVFSGERSFGSHPVIFTATENNNFSDKGCSPLRTSLYPIRVDLSQKSRETVMDEHPWSYRIMAQEAIREGRVAPQNLGVNTIDDLRNYLYVEVFSEIAGAAISVEARTEDGKVSSSDFNDRRLRISRSGFQRIAVRLPITTSTLSSLSLLCHAVTPVTGESGCGRSRITAYLRLNRDFFPVKIRANPKLNQPRSLKADEKFVWVIPASN